MTKKKQPTLADALKSVNLAIANLHMKLAAAKTDEERELLRGEIAAISASIGLQYAGPPDAETADQAATAAMQDLQNSETSSKYEAASNIVFRFVPGLEEHMHETAQAMHDAAVAQGAAEAMASAATDVDVADTEVPVDSETKPSLFSRLTGFFRRNTKSVCWTVSAVVGIAAGYAGVKYYMASKATTTSPVTAGWVHGSTEMASDASVGFFSKAVELLAGAWHYLSDKAVGLFAWVGSWFSNSAAEVVVNGAEVSAV